jgi:hypothetical protein
MCRGSVDAVEVGTRGVEQWILVVVGAMPEGRKDLIGFTDGPI